MMRVMQADEHFDDIGPDHDMEFGPVERVEFSPDFQMVLEIPFTTERLSALEDFARAQGINPIRAAERLIDEALVARARR